MLYTIQAQRKNKKKTLTKRKLFVYILEQFLMLI